MRNSINIRKPLKYFLFLLVFFVLSIISFNFYIIQNNKKDIYYEASNTPIKKVGLVLGCIRTSHFFKYRIEATAELYQKGLIEHILVSGDNHIKTYDEASDMKHRLIRLGIPPSKVTCDFAGFRTLDSVIRAKQIFGANSLIIISQEFHLYRALEIAKHHNIDAVGYSAINIENIYKDAADSREIYARCLAIIDLVVERKPKFLGTFEPIPLKP